MPQLLRVGPYVIYYWSNESEPLEPVHVHIADGRPTRDATKIWITSMGRALWGDPFFLLMQGTVAHPYN